MLGIHGPRTLNYGSPMNGEAPLNQGLVGWWLTLPMQMSGQRWVDLSGRRSGQLTNMGASSATSGWGATTHPGGRGEVRFDGTNDYVTMATSALWNLPQGSIAVWAKRRTTGVEHKIVTMCDPVTDGNDTAEILWIATDVLRIHVIKTGSYLWRAVTTAATYGVNTWYHIVLTVGAAGNAFYVNGVPVALTYNNGSAANTEFFSSIYTATATLDVGRTNSATFPSYLAGSLDDVRLYNRALSPRDIRMLYQAALQGYPQELAWQPWLPVWAMRSPKAPAPYQRAWRPLRRRRVG
jgi:Concanavalin A-like lectin/glucanases superfamily